MYIYISGTYKGISPPVSFSSSRWGKQNLHNSLPDKFPLILFYIYMCIFYIYILSSACGHLLSPVPPFGIPHPLMSAMRLSFPYSLLKLYLWIPMIPRLQYALLNFVRRALSNYSCVVFYL